MPVRSLNDIFLGRRPAQPATLTAVYSGRDIVSRRLDGRATVGDLADLLPPPGGRHTLTYVRIVIDGPRHRGL